ncbi:uncharacterized protein RAG0_11266 [Rhynchosporium agropyri]|uniref:Uncharacterized protein n=1 Tax=Rhynchosporium agropyri TaxID=914238 RepID=A0A1E1L3E8_9HELO|nr:uncharacterized protein RAG0_11266 [Rhynchosporium agropyri]
MVVPRGVLLARNPFEAGVDVEDCSRPIDRVQFSGNSFLLRVRASSIDLGGLGRTRESRQEFPSVNTMPIAVRDFRPTSPGDEDIDTLEMTPKSPNQLSR